jgi:hypothetical protein
MTVSWSLQMNGTAVMLCACWIQFRNGRVNPNGIPCLYLSSNPGAALAEMRPWVGEYITLAQFEVLDDCLVVDCSDNTTAGMWLEPVNLDGTEELATPEDATREEGLWGDIGYGFSKPVTRTDPHLDYVPTQILAEAFRNHGYHGLVYKSLLDEGGKHIALFGTEAAKPLGCSLYKAKAASFEFKRHDNNLAFQESIVSRLQPAIGPMVLDRGRSIGDARTA